MPHPYEDVVSKIKWADKHIHDFRKAGATFMGGSPYGVVVEADPNTGDKAYYEITKVPAIPPQLRLIAGDALQNLRSALDYLACGLVRMAT